MLSLGCQSQSCVSKLRPFPIGRNERGVPKDAGYKVPEDFLKKIGLDQIDSVFVRALGKLSAEQREELAKILIAREAARRNRN